MSSRTIWPALVVLVCLFSPPATAQLEGLLDSLKKLPLIGGGADEALSNDDVIGALKEALSQGAEKAIGQLGREDGYFANPNVKIPLPGALDKVETALRAVGQDRYADEFILSMNRAAERAVPEAAEVFGNVLKGMTVEDAKAILDGPDDAATQYFRRVGGKDLPQTHETNRGPGHLGGRNHCVLQEPDGQSGARREACRGRVAGFGSICNQTSPPRSLRADRGRGKTHSRESRRAVH